MVARHRDEPVMSVDEVEVKAIAELDARREHVGVHVLDPGDELPELRRPQRLANAMKVDAVDDLLGGRLLAPAGQDVNVDVERRQAFGELAYVPRKPALDQRGVLPRE